VQFRTPPTYDTPLLVKENITTSWWRFFQDIQEGTPPSPEMGIALTGSPFLYHAASGGFLIVKGAGVTKVEFTRDQATFYDVGVTQGTFPLSNRDSYRITYGAAPTLTFVQQ